LAFKILTGLNPYPQHWFFVPFCVCNYCSTLPCFSGIVSLVVYLVVAVLSLYSWAAVLAAYRLIAHQAVLRIRTHRIHMFLGLPDPDPSIMQK
jgi:hypothetical protein